MKKISVYGLFLLMCLMTLTTGSSCSRGYGCQNLAGEEQANKRSRPGKKSRGQLFDKRTTRKMPNQK
ncbi:MAG: hypothetical protein AAF741_09030 [Bacteroidota bacterium]